MIAQPAEGKLGACIHASISGTVKAIADGWHFNRKIKDGVYTVRKAVGFVEIKSIPVGIQTADEMVKAGNVELLLSTPICPVNM